MISNFKIAWRFIFSKKRSIIFSLLGIIFGTGFFIITQAQTSGFEQFFIQTILNTNGAIRVGDSIQNFHGQNESFQDFEKALKEAHYKPGVEYPSQLRDSLFKIDNITGISEILESNAQIQYGGRSQSSHIYGIRLEDHLSIADLHNQIIVGDLENYKNNPNNILMGSKLSKRLKASVGDTIKLTNSKGERNYIIAGIFETGVDDIDKVRLYMNHEEARSFFQKPYGESILQININDPNLAPSIAKQIEASFKHHATSWQEREKVWLDVFKALRISAAITVFTIIVISGLGIFNTLVMIVIEKTKEIAILRSIGYSQKDIVLIFFIQGVIILSFGLILSWIFAILCTLAISKVPLHIRGIFTTDNFLVNWNINHYLLATCITSSVALIASYIPAKRASKIDPAVIIRKGSH